MEASRVPDGVQHRARRVLRPQLQRWGPTGTSPAAARGLDGHGVPVSALRPDERCVPASGRARRPGCCAGARRARRPGCCAGARRARRPGCCAGARPARRPRLQRGGSTGTAPGGPATGKRMQNELPRGWLSSTQIRYGRRSARRIQAGGTGRKSCRATERARRDRDRGREPPESRRSSGRCPR